MPIRRVTGAGLLHLQLCLWVFSFSVWRTCKSFLWDSICIIAFVFDAAAAAAFDCLLIKRHAQNTIKILKKLVCVPFSVVVVAATASVFLLPSPTISYISLSLFLFPLIVHFDIFSTCPMSVAPFALWLSNLLLINVLLIYLSFVCQQEEGDVYNALGMQGKFTIWLLILLDQTKRATRLLIGCRQLIKL